VLLVSFAATFGATLAFLSARLLLRPWIQQRFSSQLQVINQGIIKEGGFYLFTLRIIPLFPFFVVNILMGVTSIPIKTYYWISQLGMLPAAMVYVNAGTQLAKIDSLNAILAPNLIFSFILLGIFPWLAKFIIKMFRQNT
jgi:uncharacterized membrane protein YdjX (TVP38/TMEM64 family)